MLVAAGMKVVVVGLGTSGLAVVQYLHRLGAEVHVSEYRAARQLTGPEREVLDSSAAEVETGGHSTAFIGRAELVVAGPGVPPDQPALAAVQQRGIPVVGELALAAGQIKVPVIAVTGSNGKTTVTGLIGHLLRTAGRQVYVAGNIGTPVLEYLMNPGKSEVLVLELSSFQLERGGEFRPDIGLLLNLSPDHLDWHGSMKAYSAAKQKIFAHQQREDIALIGGDDALLAAQPPETAGSLYRFGATPGCRAVVEEQAVRLQPGFGRDGGTETYVLAATRLDSRVNRYNAAAALLAARCMGCSEDDIRRGLAEYQPPEHRMTPVARINHVSFVNDSKATNVGAVIAALSGYGKTVVLIAGGRDKGSDFSLLRQAVCDSVTCVVTLGEAAGDIGRAVQDVAPVLQAQTMAEAVALAYGAAKKGDTVLLAPACASFDMFTNYGQRGLAFSQCVHELAAAEDGREDD